MAQVDGIEIKFSADTGNLESGLNRAQGAISKFAGVAQGLVATLAAGLSAGGFAVAAKSAINFADTVGKAAQKVGSSTEALSELEYAARLSDLTFADLETGMRFLSKSMINNADIFDQLGVAIKNSDGSMRTTDKVLMDLSNKFAGMPDGVQKTALAMEIFGRSGTALIPMLNAGTSGLEKMRQRAVALGLSISADTAKRAEQFNDTITDLAAVGQGAMMRLASAMLPVGQALLNISVAGAEAMVDLGSSINSILPYIATATGAIAGFYAPAILSGIAGTSSALGVGLVGALTAVKAAIVSNPIGLIASALAAVTVAMYTFDDASGMAAKAIDYLGTSINSVLPYIATAATALAGFYAPAILTGITSTSTALSVGLVGAINAVRAALLTNPLGIIATALATATVAVYAFSEASGSTTNALANLGSVIYSISPYIYTATAALAGFYAPALLSGLATTTSAIGVGLVGAINAVKLAVLANPIGLLLSALATATVAVYAFGTASTEGVSAVTQFGSAIATIAPYAATAAIALAGFYGPALLTGLATTTTAIGVGLVGAIKAVTAAMMANPLGLLIGGLAAAAVAVFAFRDDIKNAIGVDVVTIARDAANYVLRGFVNAADGISTVFKALPDAIGGALVGMSNYVLRTIADMANRAIGSINNIIDKINALSKYTGVTFERIGEVSAHQFENKFASNFDSAWSGFKSRMEERANTDVVGAFSTAFSNATSVVSQQMQNMQGIISNVAGGVATAAGGVVGAGGTSDVPAFDPNSVDLGKDGKDKGGGKGTSVAPSQEPGTYFTDRLQAIRDQFATERELLTQEYELNQQVLDNALLNERIKKEEHTSLMEQLEQQHQDKLKNIRLTAIQENLGYAADFMGSMAQIAELGGKKTTKIAKVFGIAQALISTFQGAAKALTLPFPANIAAYAQVVAQGLSAVASIKKVNENGGSNGGVSAGAASRGSAATGGGGGGGTAAAAPTTTFAFTLVNDPMGFGEKFARQFIDQLNSTQRNGGQIRGVIA